VDFLLDGRKAVMTITVVVVVVVVVSVATRRGVQLTIFPRHLN
jgi:hypothetical protein